jgi:LPXTG-motif cell wall-anchored protein
MAIAPAARADEWNQKTVFTFSGPFEIPGQVLGAGTYVFKLADSASNRHIVQVFNADGTKLFGTFLAIPDYRMHPSDKPIVRFEERMGGAPDAIKGWFYPGRNYGHEFVYPKKRAAELAVMAHAPVPAMPTELVADTTRTDTSLTGPEVAELDEAPLVVEEPDGEEVEVAAAFMTSAPHAELPDSLPETGSILPLMSIAGVVLLGAAILTRRPNSKREE